jgi:hypothetical protein
MLFSVIEGYHSLRKAVPGLLSNAHKQKEGQEMYFFTNSIDYPLATMVRLRGDVRPE